jgi:hypothetical protein
MLHEAIVVSYPSALKMETARSSEAPVNFHQTTRSHIQEDGSVRSDFREALRYKTFDIWLIVKP